MAKGSKRKRGDTWQLRVYAGVDPVTGKQRFVARTYRGSARDADRELRKLIDDVDDGYRPVQARTFGAAATKWLAANRARMSPATVMTTEDFIARYLTLTLGPRPVEKIRAEDLDELYGHLLTDGRPLAGGKWSGRPLQPATVRRVAGIVHVVLEAARRWRWTVRNVADDTQPISVPRRKPTAPEQAAARRLVGIATDHDPELGLYLRLAALIGGRRAEACALRWSAIDLDDAMLSIERRLVTGRDEAGHEKVTELPGTKTGRERHVAIDRRTVELLRAQRRLQAERALAFGSGLVADPYVFSHDPDGATGWKPHGVTTRFRRLRERLGGEFVDVRLHDLRHYVATFLLDAGIPDTAVGERIGHDSSRTTRDIYAHPVSATDRRSADLLAEALDGPIPTPGPGLSVRP